MSLLKDSPISCTPDCRRTGLRARARGGVEGGKGVGLLNPSPIFRPHSHLLSRLVEAKTCCVVACRKSQCTLSRSQLWVPLPVPYHSNFQN